MTSRLVEKLVRLSHAAQPMGFKAATAERSPAMLLIASLTTLNDESLAAASQAKVDAIVLPAAEITNQRKASRVKTAIPWGVHLAAATQAEVKLLQEKGCDFIIFQTSTAAAAIAQQKDMGKLIRVDPSLPDGLLRTINQLPVDATLLPGPEASLTVQHLMSYYRLSSLVRKPLLAEIASMPAGDELKALREAGVNGVVVQVTAGQPLDKLEKLKREIDALPAARQERQREASPILPSLAAKPAVAEEEEEEDT